MLVDLFSQQVTWFMGATCQTTLI